MSDALITYVQDHLAGAKYALSLLHDLTEQTVDRDAAQLAKTLLPEIEADRGVLEQFITSAGGDPSAIKDATAVVLQKTGQLKLSLDEPLGVFEAVELLALGVTGKIALWNALQAVSLPDDSAGALDFQILLHSANKQLAALEGLRVQLAKRALGEHG